MSVNWEMGVQLKRGTVTPTTRPGSTPHNQWRRKAWEGLRFNSKLETRACSCEVQMAESRYGVLGRGSESPPQRRWLPPARGL